MYTFFPLANALLTDRYHDILTDVKFFGTKSKCRKSIIWSKLSIVLYTTMLLIYVDSIEFLPTGCRAAQRRSVSHEAQIDMINNNIKSDFQDGTSVPFSSMQCSDVKHGVLLNSGYTRFEWGVVRWSTSPFILLLSTRYGPKYLTPQKPPTPT